MLRLDGSVNLHVPGLREELPGTVSGTQAGTIAESVTHGDLLCPGYSLRAAAARLTSHLSAGSPGPGAPGTSVPPRTSCTACASSRSRCGTWDRRRSRGATCRSDCRSGRSTTRACRTPSPRGIPFPSAGCVFCAKTRISRTPERNRTSTCGSVDRCPCPLSYGRPYGSGSILPHLVHTLLQVAWTLWQCGHACLSIRLLLSGSPGKLPCASAADP